MAQDDVVSTADRQLLNRHSFNRKLAEIFRRLIRDVGTGETTYRMYDRDGRIRFDSHGLEMGSVREHIFRIHDDDPLSASAQTLWVKETGRSSWQVSTVTRATLTSAPESFVIHAELDAYEGDRRVYSSCERAFSAT